MDESDTQRSFSHQDWQSVLQTFVREDGRVDYQAMAKNRANLDRYLQAIETYGPDSHPNLFPTRNDALAYSINAYNAHVVAGVLARGPEEHSVWSGLISGFNFFVKMRIVVGGEKMSLKTFEEQHILKIFKEPRVHAALNCASVGCPPLSRDAYLPETLDHQLQAAATRWINDPYHCRSDPESRSVTVNKIFDWFKDDFIEYEERVGNKKPNLVSFINRFRPENEQIPESYAVRFSEYDKLINSVP